MGERFSDTIWPRIRNIQLLESSIAHVLQEQEALTLCGQLKKKKAVCSPHWIDNMKLLISELQFCYTVYMASEKVKVITHIDLQRVGTQRAFIETVDCITTFSKSVFIFLG